MIISPLWKTLNGNFHCAQSFYFLRSNAARKSWGLFELSAAGSLTQNLLTVKGLEQ